MCNYNITCCCMCCNISSCQWHAFTHTKERVQPFHPSCSAPARNSWLHLCLPLNTLCHLASTVFIFAHCDLPPRFVLTPSKESALLLFPHRISIESKLKISFLLGTVPPQISHEWADHTGLQRHVSCTVQRWQSIKEAIRTPCSSRDIFLDLWFSDSGNCGTYQS